VGSHSVGGFQGSRWQHPDDRLLVDTGASARRQRPKKALRSRCMGRSRGGLTAKIHALVDASGLDGITASAPMLLMMSRSALLPE